MSHLKRLSMPKSWPIKRKGIKFVIKSKPGPHSLDTSIPLGIVLRDILRYCNTMREAKFILNNKIILVDGRRRKDYRFPVGLFDIIRIADIEGAFRVVFDEKGGIKLISDKPLDVKLCKIVGKNKIKGKMQLKFSDGKTLILDKEGYNVGDSLFVNLPKMDVKEHIKFEKGALIYLTGGKHIGETGRIDDVVADNIIYKNDKNVLVATLKKYAFPVGKDKSLIKIKE